jgi:hypothetical protein
MLGAYCNDGINVIIDDGPVIEDMVTYIIFNCKDISGTFSTFTNLMEIELTGVETICDYAFKNCYKLYNAFIPNKLRSIGRHAFNGCPLIAYHGHANLFACVDGVSTTTVSIGDYAFANTKIEQLEIPNYVNEIGTHAFENCRSLRIVTFEAGSILTKISDFTFKDSFLMLITLPDSVETIGVSAFHICVFLRSVTFGANLTTIQNNAFSYCSSLSNVNIPENVDEIGNAAFSKCEALTNVSLGSGLTAINNGLFKDCVMLNNVIIPDKITSIGVTAFSGCSNLTNVVLGTGVKTIGLKAFFDCSKLTNIILPLSVTTVGQDAFQGCSALKTVRINGVPSISSTFGNHVETLIAPFESISKFNVPTLKNVTILKSVVDPVIFDCVGFTGNLTFSNGIKDISLLNGSIKMVRLPASCESFKTTAEIQTLCIPPKCEFSTRDKVTSCIRVVKPAATSLVRIDWTDYTKALFFEDGIEAIYFDAGGYQLSSLRIPDACQMVHLEGATFPSLSSPWLQVMKQIAQQVR